MKFFSFLILSSLFLATMASLDLSRVPPNKVDALLSMQAKGLVDVQNALRELAVSDCGAPGSHLCQLKDAVLASPHYTPNK